MKLSHLIIAFAIALSPVASMATPFSQTDVQAELQQQLDARMIVEYRDPVPTKHQPVEEVYAVGMEQINGGKTGQSQSLAQSVRSLFLMSVAAAGTALSN